MMNTSCKRRGDTRRIGLLGGSFNPAHDGHRHISLAALRRLALDEVWWLVTPGNPLKDRGPAPLEQRMAAARAVMDHPRVEITDLEHRLGTRYTAETLAALIKRYPGVRFVWLMGADNLAQFHRWDRWRWIMETVPVGVIARPAERITARTSPAADRYHAARLRGREAQRLATAKPPAWCFVNVPMVALSSSEIRARGDWNEA